MASSMFWGLNLKPNRKYSQTTGQSFHISNAALDRESSQQNGYNQVFLTNNNEQFLLCTLQKGGCEQFTLDLNFAKGDDISFQTKGTGNVSLSGYIILDDEDYMNGLSDEEGDVSVDDLRKILNKKGKSGVDAADSDDSDEDDEDGEDDDDETNNTLEGQEDDGDSEDVEEDDEEDEEDDEEDEEDEDEEDSDEEVQQPKAKQPKLEKKQNGVVKGKEAAAPAEQKGKKAKTEANKQQQQQQKNQQKPAVERTLSGGVKVEDIRVGTGPEVKQGKRAAVYYEGRLKSNNKAFDSHKTGAGFKFTVGRGEVIKAWDVGVAGMKVGGKRRITCPPHMAYGVRGSPPTIPPNSTLVFEVELKGVN